MKKALLFILLVSTYVINEAQTTVFNSLRHSEKTVRFNPTKVKTTIDTSVIETTITIEKIDPIRTIKPNSFLPVEFYKITSKYGYRFHPIEKRKKFHYGIDLKTNKSNVYAVLKGVVTKAEYDKHLGYYVKIKHNKVSTLYGHLSKLNVKVGEKVKAGDIIGISGKTGKATGDHLHFAVKCGHKYLNPNKLLSLLKLL